MKKISCNARQNLNLVKVDIINEIEENEFVEITLLMESKY